MIRVLLERWDGKGGLSVILGNETQSIACTANGAVAAEVLVNIPFTGYVGIEQTPVHVR